MGARGPIPNRSDDLSRPRERRGGEHLENPITKGTLRPVNIPEPDEDWDPIALMLWESLLTSGQADFYQNSDWVFAYSLCEDITRYKAAHINQTTGELYYKRSPEMLKALQSAMASLLVTEGDRRRVRIELSEPPKPKDNATLHLMAEYEQGLGLDDDDEPEETE